MSRIIHSKFGARFFLFILWLVLSACTQIDGPDSRGEEATGWWNYISRAAFLESLVTSEAETDTYPIEPIFLDFYQQLGGRDILGPAISTAITSGNVIRQYVEAGLLVYDSSRPFNDRYFLAPLGKEFEIADAVEAGDPSNAQVGLGREDIFPPFLTLYEKLGGARFVGLPLTPTRHNPAKGRIEQYFENLGFYLLDQDESNKVRLMAYGAYACDLDCRYKVDIGGIPSRQPVLPEPFAAKSNELGLPFTGRILTEVYTTQENSQEVVFENLVLVAEEGQSEVKAKPILDLIGFEKQPLNPPSDDPLMVFIPLEGNLGHNVPIHFLNYLQDHGGMEFAGRPASEVFLAKEGHFWQCFENLCLEFLVGGDGNDQLRPVPLGTYYKQSVYDHARDFYDTQSLQGIELTVWEKYLFMEADDRQVIFANVHQSGMPLSNREPILYLTMPDGSVRTLYFPPTNSSGQTQLELDPIKVPNGTVMAYRVCLHGLKEEQECAGESYLIWNSD